MKKIIAVAAIALLAAVFISYSRVSSSHSVSLKAGEPVMVAGGTGDVGKPHN